MIDELTVTELQRMEKEGTAFPLTKWNNVYIVFEPVSRSNKLYLQIYGTTRYAVNNVGR